MAPYSSASRGLMRALAELPEVRQANVVLGPCDEGREGGGGKDEEAGKGHAHRSNDDTITQ